jgi:hypothetical protein
VVVASFLIPFTNILICSLRDPVFGGKVTGDVVTVAFPKNQDLIIAERLFPHLDNSAVATVLMKASQSLSSNGVLVADFYTKEHHNAKSRGANYRDIAEIRKLVERDFTIISEKNVGGLVTFVLKPKRPNAKSSAAPISDPSYVQAKNQLLNDPSLTYQTSNALKAVISEAEAAGKPLTQQSFLILLVIVKTGVKNKWSFFAIRQGLLAVAADRTLTSKQAIEAAKANEYLHKELSKRFPLDGNGLSELWSSNRSFGVLSVRDAKLVIGGVAQVVNALQRSYPAPRNTREDLEFSSILAREAIWKSVREVLASGKPISDKVAELKGVGNFQSEVMEQFRSSPFAQQMGSRPTSYVYGGNAQTGLFAGVKGNSTAELIKNINARVDELVSTGTLTLIAGGALRGGTSNRVFLNNVTGEIIRVGDVSSIELSESIGLPRISSQLGARVFPEQSLYVPLARQAGASSSFGFSVLVMENVGKPMLTEFNNLSAEQKKIVLDSFFDALVQLHMSGRYHTDLHLQNVMIDNGRAVIIDFGRIERSNFAAINSRQADGLRNPTNATLVNEKDNYTLAQALGQFGVTTADFRQRYRQALERLPTPTGQASKNAFDSRRNELMREMNDRNWIVR